MTVECGLDLFIRKLDVTVLIHCDKSLAQELLMRRAVTNDIIIIMFIHLDLSTMVAWFTEKIHQFF